MNLDRPVPTDPDEIAAALEEHRVKSCTTPFSIGTARAVVESHAASGEKREVYRCRFCDSWHVGHPLTMAEIVWLAALYRAASGNAPAPAHRPPKRERRHRQR